MQSETAENRDRTVRLHTEFNHRFEGEPTVVRAPGRVNLIGEHTDYNDGFVLPIAIDQDVRFAVRPRTDRRVVIHSLNFDTDTEFDLDDIRRDEQHDWGNYIRGMAVQLLKAGLLLHGMEGVVEGNVPIASGLSSSAAMEVASGMAFCATSKQVVDSRDLALMAQAAENEYMGVRSGIMDQFVSRLGHSGCALFLDCRTLEFELISADAPGYLWVVADSKQSRELAGSAYNERRTQCEEAVRGLRQALPEIRALRDVSAAELEEHQGLLDPLIYRRARHVVTENERTLAAVEAIRAGDWPRMGALMNASHDSLRDDYEVSSRGLDTLVNAARAENGCLGSRLTGAGFGGCTVSLVDCLRVDDFIRAVRETYQRDCGTEAAFYVTRAAAGAGVISCPGDKHA
ncbi:MAG: galactokinase [Armatimonadota bacterium]